MNLLKNTSKNKLKSVEKELNVLHQRLDQMLSSGSLETDFSVRSLRLEIDRCSAIVDKQREIEAKNIIYLSRAKWAEDGEKSTKYFLNLMKSRSADSYLHVINTPNGEVSEQKLIEKEIHLFYSQLYELQPSQEDHCLNDLFLTNNPQISSSHKNHMDSPLTLLDLYASLHSCKDSLIPKKDKDKTILSNLRPISLTNTDVKIITKAITIKLNPILDSIISPTQTAYVPKRQVTDNNLLLDKIIQLANKTEESLFVLSLDAKKAFDSVDHEYMYRTLKSFGFGDEFISVIRVIYKDLTASILVNGFKTQIIKLLRGVKQGDALSCALFIICVEPLFRSIQDSQNITGYKVRSPYSLETTECKLAGYADDFTPIVSNPESIKEVIKIYHKFSLLSGIYLNPDKTEVLKVGPHGSDPVQELVVDYGGQLYRIKPSKHIVVCGVSHPIDCEVSYNHNITNKIAKMKQLLNSWRCRNLSIIGKILITKVFGLSQLIYFLQTCSITNEDLKIVESALYSFVWSSKSARPNDKIKRSILKATALDGGLNAPDIFSLNRALKYKKWLRTTLNLNHPISIIQDRLLFHEGIADKFPQVISKSTLSRVQCSFYRLALETNNIMSNIIQSEICYKHARNEVDPQYLTFLLLAFPKLWITLLSERADWKLNSYTTESVYIGDQKWVNGQYVSTRQIRLLLTKQNESRIDKIDIVHKHGLDQDPVVLDTTPVNPFEMKNISSVFLRATQYKILHQAYTTRSKLFLYKIIDSPLCPFCEQSEDNFEHALYKCDLSKYTWSNFQSWLDSNGIPFQLHIPNIILGVNEQLQFGQILNSILINIKRILLSPAEQRRAMTTQEIEKIVIDLLRTEIWSKRYIKKKTTIAVETRLVKRWGHLLNLLESKIVI